MADGDLDWDILYRYLCLISEEIKDIFPYAVIKSNRCEADDIIAVISKAYHKMEENVIIISSDKDFRQLQTYENVKQFSPYHNDFLVEKQPETYLKQHILSGDVGDAIPNALSDPDTFVVKGKRQTPLTAKRLTLLMGAEPTKYESRIKIGYDRNKSIVDLIDGIPLQYQDQILKDVEKSINNIPSGQLIMTYLMKKKLQNLMDVAQDFV